MPAVINDTIEAILDEATSGALYPEPEPARPLQPATPEALPAISVLVASGCSGSSFLRTLESISEARSELRQRRGEESELVVASYGGLSDNLLYAEEFDARVIYRNLPTLSSAVNAAAAAAKGRILVLVGSRLLLTKDALCHILHAMSDATALGGSTPVHVQNRTLASRLVSLVCQIPLRLTGLNPGILFVQKRTFETLRGLKESMLSGQTLEFALRLKRHAVMNGLSVNNVKQACATRENDWPSMLNAKEWLMLLLLPLLWRS